jgi:protein ImuB
VGRLACVDLRPRIPLVGPAAEVVTERLRCFSPNVERAEDIEGLFWLDADGLSSLYPSLTDWAEQIHGDLRALGFEAVVIVGFSRFGVFALARSARGVYVFDDEAQEAAACGNVPLKCLNLPEPTLGTLARLNKRTVADLLSLPAGGLLERFGPELHRLYRLASHAAWDPLQPDAEEPTFEERIDLDYPEVDATRLTFWVKRLLRPLLTRVRDCYRTVREIGIELELYREAPSVQRIAPAEPTLDEMQLIDLVRLRLEGLTLPAGAVAILLRADTVPATSEQLEMFQKKPLRDLDAANRALARLIAELGPNAVVRATLRQGHLPEARFALEPVAHVAEPSLEGKGAPRPNSLSNDSDIPFRGTLVRRILSKPVRLHTKPVVGPRGCHLQGMGEAPATRTCGPYIVSGGWWVREVHREYYFAETEAGEVLWVYYDRRRRSWFLHGRVE